jgi:hypothetical protein
MTDARLTDELALRIMGWKAARDRFVKAERSWIPKWRFRPLVQLDDAFQLLDRAAHRYTLTRDGRTFTAEIETKSGRGIAVGELQARTISLAIARGLGLEVNR